MNLIYCEFFGNTNGPDYILWRTMPNVKAQKKKQMNWQVVFGYAEINDHITLMETNKPKPVIVFGYFTFTFCTYHLKKYGFKSQSQSYQWPYSSHIMNSFPPPSRFTGNQHVSCLPAMPSSEKCKSVLLISISGNFTLLWVFADYIGCLNKWIFKVSY